MTNWAEKINRLVSNPSRDLESLGLLADFRDALNRGEVRAASPADGGWTVHPWVRRGLLLHAALGEIGEQLEARGAQAFDYDTLPMRRFRKEDRVRVAFGAQVRDGVYLGPNTQCLPPSMINIGAYVDEGSLIDSNVMIGSCAQIGKRVSVGSGSQIGGVLAPEDAWPNVIEDDVVICGNCGVYDGVRVGKGAILSAGTVLYGVSVVYDATTGGALARGPESALEIPPNAVVMSACRTVQAGPLKDAPVQPQAAMIVGYRNDGENAAEVLRRILA